MNEFDTNFNGVDYILKVFADAKCKLIIKKNPKILCELEFDNFGEFLNMVNELQSFGSQMIEEEEYKLGLREFYLER